MSSTFVIILTPLQKREATSPTPSDDSIDEVERCEQQRIADALSLSEENTVITSLPTLSIGYSGVKARELDQEQSVFEGSDVEDENVARLCDIINGEQPIDALDALIKRCDNKSIWKVLTLAFDEINTILLDGIDEKCREANELDISVDDDNFVDDQDELFSEDNEDYFSSKGRLRKADAVSMLLAARREIAWLRDNCDNLVHYIDFARKLEQHGAEFDLVFHFYQRDRGIEMRSNVERERVRTGGAVSPNQFDEDQQESPKRQKVDPDTMLPRMVDRMLHVDHRPYVH